MIYRSYDTIRKIEKGKKMPSLETVTFIALVLGVSVDSLIMGNGENRNIK